jgi:hypothetical protein
MGQDAPTPILPAGISLRSTDHSVVKDNLVCEISSMAIQLGSSGSTTLEVLRNPESFDPGNGDNIIKGNRLLGYDPDSCAAPGTGQDGYCYSPATPGVTLSDEGWNEIKDNVANPSGTCPRRP